MIGDATPRQRASRAEGLISDALREKYSNSPELLDTLTTHGPLSRWNVVDFLDAYVSGGVYPADRLHRLADMLLDIKLQLYFILEVDLGCYNLLVHDRGYDKSEPLAHPHVYLTRLSLDQTLIGKSRVLWERLMNLIYFLETGEELESKRSRKRSKQTAFFEFVSKDPKLRFLEPYRQIIEQYDQSYRTPEYHKSSVLRSELLGGRTVDANDLPKLINAAINNIWENLISIVGGGKPVSFSELHLSESGEIDAKYLL